MQKSFLGTLDSSYANEWADKDGKIVQCWLINVLFNDERGMRFNISKNNPVYDYVQNIPTGSRVRCDASSKIMGSGNVRWTLDSIVVVTDD